MRGLVMAAMTAAVLWLEPARAQLQQEEIQRLSGLIGVEVRRAELDEVVGVVETIEVEANGVSRATIWLERTGRAVVVDLAQLRREGGKLYLSLSDEQLAAMPEAGATPDAEPSSDRPFGGVTPGWGLPQGATGR